MYDELFKEVDLEVIELPIEMIDGKTKFSAYIRQLPFIAAEGESRQAVFRKLAEAYAIYRQEHLPKEEETEEKQLTIDELLRYYDGETIDGYGDFFKE
ncbi:hypothetical protein [Enterococcus sp. HY326]|uniref:hypothetical protein n=1 Tax=Enterococcus sp. HY326 TaxID=2971265 RepID=UPI00223EB07E|nr:hypothetical protein [Enterococcus sp. HY326]